MTERSGGIDVKRGDRVVGPGGRTIGRVDAVYADYLLVRSGWILPVDLYVPRDAVRTDGAVLRVDLDRSAAYRAWHRPLKRVEHD